MIHKTKILKILIVLLHCVKLVQLFGLCSTAGIDVMKMYRVQGGSETLLMFKEDIGTPSTTITVRVTLHVYIDRICGG